MAEFEDDDWGYEEEEETQEEQEETTEETEEVNEEQNEEESDSENETSQEETEESANEETGENNTKVSDADKQAYETLKSIDESYDGTEEGSFQKLVEAYHKVHEQNEQYAKDSKAIADALDSDPDMADVLTAVADGVPFKVAIATYMDLDDIKPMEGDDDYERYVEESDKRKAEREAQKKEVLQIEENRKETAKVSKEFFDEQGMTEEERNGFVDFFDKILDDISHGKVTKETLLRIHNAYTYNDAVESARKQGEVAGRNQRIEQKRETKRKETDGLPSGGTSVNENNDNKEGSSKIFGWLGKEGKYYND